MIKINQWKKILIIGFLFATLQICSQAQINMNPYFTAINYPVDKNSMMLMAMSDFNRLAMGTILLPGC